jgi:hypothetical protein
VKRNHMFMHLTLALIGLTAAYVTANRPKEAVRSETVTVLNTSSNSLEKIRFEDGPRFFELQKSNPRPLLTLGFLPGQEPKPAPAPSDGGLMTSAPKAPPTRSTPTNERGEGVFAKFAPLEAQRALGQLSDAKLDELGLLSGTRLLTVKAAGAERVFKVAKPLPGVFGSYLQDANSKEVYLVAASLFSDLDPTSQMLVDRRPHVFKQSEFDSFTVRIGKNKGEFVQKNADIPQSAIVARAKTPDKPDELVKNWHDKIFNRLIVTEVLGKDELPSSGVPELKMRVEYFFKAKSVGFLEISRDTAGATWARSENSASYLGVHQGSEELVSEAEHFISAP